MRARNIRWLTGPLAALALAACHFTAPLGIGGAPPPTQQARPGDSTLKAVPLRRLLDAPLNDNFVDARVITELPYAEEINTREATTEQGETGCFEPPKQTVWWAFTPPRNMILVADALSFDYLTDMSVWTGSSVDGLTQIACNAFGATSRWEATGGVTYYIRTSTILGETGGTEAFSLREGQPQITVEATVDHANVDSRTGLVTVSGTVTTNTSGGVFIEGSLNQRSGRLLLQGTAQSSIDVPGGTVPWQITSQPNGTFKSGTIEVALGFTAFNSETNDFIHVKRLIKLTGKR